MLFYDLSIIRDSQNHHYHQGFGSLYGELPKEKLQKLALQAPLRSHEIFKERYDTKSHHTLLTCYILPILPFFHFIACWYCQIMSRVTLHNFWPTIERRIYLLHSLFRKIVKNCLRKCPKLFAQFFVPSSGEKVT